MLSVLTNPVSSYNDKMRELNPRLPCQQTQVYSSSQFLNDFDDAMLKKGTYILNRDRSDSINVFKQKSPGLINDNFDDSPNISPVL